MCACALYTCTHTCIYIFVYVYVHACVHVHAHIYTCMYVCTKHLPFSRGLKRVSFSYVMCECKQTHARYTHPAFGTLSASRTVSSSAWTCASTSLPCPAAMVGNKAASKFLSFSCVKHANIASRRHTQDEEMDCIGYPGGEVHHSINVRTYIRYGYTTYHR